MRTRFIGVVGGMGSGKSTVIAQLKDEWFGTATIAHAGNVVRAYLQEIGVTVTRENLQRIGREKRIEHGPAFWMDMLLEPYRDQPGGTVIVDGYRDPGEGEMLRRASQEVFIIGLRAPVDVRLKRRLADPKPDDPTDEAALLAVMMAELDPAPGSATGDRIEDCLLGCDVVIDAGQHISGVRIEIRAAVEDWLDRLQSGIAYEVDTDDYVDVYEEVTSGTDNEFAIGADELER